MLMNGGAPMRDMITNGPVLSKDYAQLFEQSSKSVSDKIVLRGNSQTLNNFSGINGVSGGNNISNEE